MTPLETVKAAIAGTMDPEMNRDFRNTLIMVAETMFERDDAETFTDRLLTEAARRAIEAMPITDAMVEAIRQVPVTMEVMTAVGKAILRYLPPGMSTEDLGALSYDAVVALKHALIAEIAKATATGGDNA